MSPPGQDNPAAAPAGGLGPHEDSRALQGEPATALAESPDTDVRFPLLVRNVTPAIAGEQGPEENASAVQVEPALTAPAPPVPGSGLALPRAPGPFPKPPSPRSPLPLLMPPHQLPKHPIPVLSLLTGTHLPLSRFLFGGVSNCSSFFISFIVLFYFMF